jgi:hypothetical protein
MHSAPDSGVVAKDSAALIHHDRWDRREHCGRITAPPVSGKGGEDRVPIRVGEDQELDVFPDEAKLVRYSPFAFV